MAIIKDLCTDEINFDKQKNENTTFASRTVPLHILSQKLWIKFILFAQLNNKDIYIYI